MMTKREVIKLVLEAKRPPYVPWNIGVTEEAREKLQQHFGQSDPSAPLRTSLEDALQNHFLRLGSDIGFFTARGDNCFQDVFGVIWDRSIDKDIGSSKNCALPKPTLKGYNFPDPLDPRFFADIPERIEKSGDRFRVFQIGFSLWERAWTMRGWENLMMDFSRRGYVPM